MRPQFTVFQKVMTALFITMQLAVMIGDVVKLATADKGGSGTYYYVVNLLLCAVLLAVFLMLIFKPEICLSSDDTDSEQQFSALLRASRTYMCFIAVDIAMIFTFVIFISQHVKHPAIWIVIGGVAMFIAGAVKYISDARGNAELPADEQQPAEANAGGETEVKDNASEDEAAISEEKAEAAYDKEETEPEEDIKETEEKAEEAPSEIADEAAAQDEEVQSEEQAAEKQTEEEESSEPQAEEKADDPEAEKEEIANAAKEGSEEAVKPEEQTKQTSDLPDGPKEKSGNAGGKKKGQGKRKK